MFQSLNCQRLWISARKSGFVLALHNLLNPFICEFPHLPQLNSFNFFQSAFRIARTSFLRDDRWRTNLRQPVPHSQRIRQLTFISLKVDCIKSDFKKLCITDTYQFYYLFQFIIVSCPSFFSAQNANMCRRSEYPVVLVKNQR